ncbi:oxysterol-binding protein-related protein 4C-like [Euphorbia lathyris]|uniref:oxysterol-binding protein-related protein 4C-like n=1 Tax=Euphorbia lathyris TaxID=212925 RepID=UPI00331343D7
MINGDKNEKKVILTAPTSLDDSANYQAPNLVRRILSLLTNLRPGSDLTNFQLSPLFNLPKSQLQGFGEWVYAVREDMLSKCNHGKNPVERLIAVVAWSFSTMRPVNYGLSPYNPILGETHHVMKGSLNLLLEQVEHHPPVFALHATDEKENIEMIWCQNTVAKFHGTRVEAGLEGKRKLKLHNYGETYVMNTPKLHIRFIPPGADWVGNVQIECQETGLVADLCFLSNSFFGRREPHSIKGKIYHSNSPSNILYHINGHWNSIITVKDTKTGKESVIYNAKEIVSGLKTPIVKDPQGIWETESGAVWSEVSEAIMSKNWEKATEAKKSIEEKQRELKRERDSKGQTWLPKHFILSKNNGTWESSPIQKSVPPAPIVVPL